MRPRSLLPISAVLAAVLSLPACSGGTTTTPSDPLADVYVLTHLNGAQDPLVLAEYTYPSGTRTLWVVTYDSIFISSATQARRSYEVLMLTQSVDGVAVAPVVTPISRKALLTRSGDRLVFDYDQTSSRMKSDTMFLDNGKLVKQGPFGVACTDCTPPALVEYIYEPR